MPRKGWKAPECRDIRLKINVTADELMQIDAKAAVTGVPRAIYVREAALGVAVAARPRAVTMDGIRTSKVVGALNDCGSRVQRLVDVLSIGDEPLAEQWRGIESKIEVAIATLLKALEGQ